MVERSIDELMWFIAEEGDHQAVEGFIKRYPEHRAEMVKRMNLVRQVRGARPESEKPKFTPRDEIRQLAQPKPRYLLAVGVAASLVAASWAGYAAVRSKATGPLGQSSITVKRESPQPNPRLDPTYDPNQNVVPPAPVPPPPTAPYEKLVTLTSESISLVAVLDEISRQTGTRIELAPDMPNPDVEAMYEKRPALSVLQDLGSRYGFTAFSQENDHVLLIPARDPQATEPQEQQAGPPEGEPGHEIERDGLPAIQNPSAR